MGTNQTTWRSRITWPQLRTSLAIALVALPTAMVAGVVTPGGVAFAAECTNAAPGASDYCASNKCGLCGEGEGDCDPGQCGSGLTCVEEGSVDHCRYAGCAASPGASDYCGQCGPCDDGEGDCDPGQCGSGLTCVEEGSVDHCRPDGCSLPPGDHNYCAQCGLCGDGEGDCDPGQCASGLTCVEEGSVDHCRYAGCGVAPGTSDYCAQCGVCGDGEGDCDPGQCGSGLTCVEEGAIDHCRYAGCAVAPGTSDYCAQCGVCGEGEGDCDPGQCGSGLTCVEEGAVDHCRVSGGGWSNLQVRSGGVWKSVCCEGSTPRLSDRSCWWSVAERIPEDESAGLKLDCPEGDPARCQCNAWGESLHGAYGQEVGVSFDAPDGGPIYPNFELQTCVVVGSAGELRTTWTSSSCPRFRLQ